MVLLVERIMQDAGEAGRGTVGALAVAPGSPNVIPGEVRFSVEFRHPEEAQLAAQAERFRTEAAAIAARRGLALVLEERFRIPAQPFDPACVALVRQAAERLGLPAMEIVSGAGHDAVHVAAVVPTAMIFVPCREGLSHNEAESIDPPRPPMVRRCCWRWCWRAPGGWADRGGTAARLGKARRKRRIGVPPRAPAQAARRGVPAGAGGAARGQLGHRRPPVAGRGSAAPSGLWPGAPRASPRPCRSGPAASPQRQSSGRA